VKYVAIMVIALVIAACSEGMPYVAEPAATEPPWGPVESTQPPPSVDALVTVPDPLTEDGVGYLITKYLPGWMGEPALGGEVFCGYELYGWEQNADVAEAWLWADCREYYVDLGALVVGTAGTAPMTIHFVESSSGWMISFVDHAEDGGMLSISVREMFPPDYADRALSSNPTNRNLGAELEHAARSKLVS
jgi:hypothetical protein